jgi:uncharacterized membrane protein AbrB (regulator of aidB expression)
MTLRMLLQYVGAALGSFAVASAIVCVGLAVVVQVVTVPIPDLVVSFSPGAQETMMIMALALHLDPVFVGAHHLARFIIVSVGIPMATRLIVRPAAVKARGRPQTRITPDD